MKVTLHINGIDRRLDVDPRATLCDTLHERLGLTGTKKGCDRGECGACTVHVNGRRILSCMTLAVMHEDDAITTIEGVAEDGMLHPVQAAFIEHDAFQCGYCTSGQIMSAIACIDEGHARSADEIREFMSGNICRCGAYAGIVAAVASAAGRA
jgi:xanthine dehydrogenase YagT iron-sulfur-binding subunit